MSRPTLVLGIVLTVLCGTSALAQNSLQGPPQAAAKTGGVEGDPLGAIRSLGSAEGSDTKQVVTVPQLGGSDKDQSRRLPSGTSGPGAR